MTPRPAPLSAAARRGPVAKWGVARPTFREIYEAHFDFVWRSLRRLGVDSAQLEDVAQEVFVVVHRRLGEFEGRSSLKTWIYGIASRVAHTARRSAARRRTEPLGAVECGGPGPHRATEAAQAARLVHALLEAVPEDRREVFVLAELEQMTAPEIADAMGIPINTVYSRLRVARKEFDAAVKRHNLRNRP